MRLDFFLDMAILRNEGCGSMLASIAEWAAKTHAALTVPVRPSSLHSGLRQRTVR